METKSTYYDDESLGDSSNLRSVRSSGTVDARKNLEKAERELLGRKETEAVGLLRAILVLMLCCTAVVTTFGVYFYGRKTENETFKTHFLVSARKVVESFHDSFERKLTAADAFSLSITSYALASGSAFPNVTLPHFAIRGSNSRIMSDGIVSYWLPLVTDTTKSGWEAYSRKNQGWIDNAMIEEEISRLAQNDDFELRRKLSQYDHFRGKIFGYGLEQAGTDLGANSSDRFLPLWQMTPVLPMKSDLNFDMLSQRSFLSEALEATLESGNVVLSRATDFADPKTRFTYSDTSSLYREFLQAGQYRHRLDEYAGEPTTNLLYPVFNNFGPKRSVVGIFMTSVLWSLYFFHTLPENTIGVICVLENTRNQSFTYRLDGNNVTFLGPGDMHDRNYNHLEVTVDVKARVERDAGPENWSYTAADLNADYCRYTLRVYPSEAMEDSFITNEPILFAVTVAFAFFFTSLFFVGYDCMVARRQSIVLSRAVASGAIVSSLFPETVRNRLLNESPKTDYKGKMQNMMNFGSNEIVESSDPIADHFPATTIMFGDLAGFTAWSANREPEHVFELLERLYKAFDSLAIRRKVFKVETIGDCYVAVTGLPDPQPTHAVIMARFASECMAKMDEITGSLLDTLGADTGELAMRIGLHSGPVTAGVLRGQKARFQLFGDTMNTASRMESNGVKGKIHISQETADQLVASGKDHWVSLREDKIVAKGKGELQTFWLHVRSRTFSDQLIIDRAANNRKKSMRNISNAVTG